VLALPQLVVRFVDPVTARFVPATGIFVAEFPVTISDPAGSGGDLLFVEAVVSNRSRGGVVATNRRPSVSHPYPDTRVPQRGSLTVEAGVGFEPPPAGDRLAITVRARLTDGREAVWTAVLEQGF
jgi:hypothetical protein